VGNDAGKAMIRSSSLGVKGLAPVAAVPWVRRCYRFNALFALVLCSWLVTVAGVWLLDGLLVWAAGLLYVAYDAALLAFVAFKTRRLHGAAPDTTAAGAVSKGLRAKVSIAIIIAARNERAMLPHTVRNALAQIEAGDQVLVMDNGSTDGTLHVLQQEFGLQADGDCYRAGALCVVQQATGGKARALNHGLGRVATDVVITLDADTLLGDNAVSALRQAFAHNPQLIAACGILRPRCAGAGVSGHLFEWFQTFEYIRAFLSRAAWMQSNALLLVSGAFAGYRLHALQKVGGFRVESRVEDYELIHRIHRYSYEQQLGWQVSVVPTAYAQTDAPATLRSFLVQRQRWFSGFLQTLHANRDMVGDPHYGAVGRFMLPVKVVDTLQPIFGMTAFLLLVFYVATWQPVAQWVLLVIGIKLAVDVSFHLWSVYVYHRWLGRRVLARTWILAVVAAFVEPFSFQLMRHAGALIGWSSFLTHRIDWIPQRRPMEQS
jgi:cellulose synthase/poly-beta-1,6-N-acetylglucosamine synthase-like glycosyltransferase